MRAISFFEYYKLVGFLFNAEWFLYGGEMDMGDRQDFLLEMDFSLGQFQE